MASMDRDAILAQFRLVTALPTDEISDAEVVLLINSCVDEVGIADRWAWLEASETLSLVDSQQAYSLPTAFEFMVAMVDDDNDKTVPYIAPAAFFSMYGNDTGNESTTFNFYTIWESQIYLTPTPSASDTDRFTCYYYKTATQLSTGSTAPEWHEAFHQIVVEYVKWKAYERAEYWDQANTAFISYQYYLQKMKEWYARKAKRMPGIVGDGFFPPQTGDPNLPWINQV